MSKEINLEGKEVSIEGEIEKIINEYNNRLKDSSKTLKEEKENLLLPPFKNIITGRGENCAGGLGIITYLVNTDRHNRYSVTVRKYVSNPRGYSDRNITYIMEAGSARRLGCAMSGYEIISYTVVGEVVLSGSNT